MMTIVKLVLARYFHKPMSTLLSIILFAIGVSVISLVIKAEYYLENSYRKNLAGIDLVVGAKGSPLQLILSSVLHIDAPTGNISLDEVHKIEKNPLVKKTIPIALGDNYKGFRIVGTVPAYAELYNAQMLQGKIFKKPLEAVVGANVAKTSGLSLGDTFVGVHGLMHEGHSHGEFKYTVTGILKQTGSVIDNLILTPVESVWMVHSAHHHDGDEAEEHDHEATEAGEHEHDHHSKGEHEDDSISGILHKIEHGEELIEEEVLVYNNHKGILADNKQAPENQITSLLVFYQNPMAAATLPRMINENTTLQAASPALEFNRLLSLLGYGITVLEVLAWIIILISGINIFIYLLNTINQSIGEIALLRATGVSRPKIFVLILSQGTILSVFGWLSGIVLSNTIWQFMPWNGSNSAFNSYLVRQDLLQLLYCLTVAVVAGIIPAVKIYRTKIHYLLTR
jgi:putative ABC transport system permease protein